MTNPARALAATIVFFCLQAPARADGAFPDSFGILLPSDQPNRIIGATNFGLLESEDDGATWAWVCEEAIGLNTFIYQQGAAPNDLLLAVSLDGLTNSADFGCSWQRSGGSISDAYVYDAFLDPTSPLHAYALGRRNAADGGTPPQTLFESSDGARTFNVSLYTSSQSLYVSGVENARSNPQTVYLTLYDLQPVVHPYVARSDDRGATWQRFDLGSLGAQTIQLLGVDPVNASRIYLRLGDLTTARDRLGISNDGGATAQVLKELPTRMSAFLRRSDGALIVAATDGSAFISTDGGATFTSWPNAPHFRALGERNRILYAVADNFVDGFAVGRSFDNGATWQPLIRYEQLSGPKRCGNLETVCAVPWQTLQARLAFTDAGTPNKSQRSGCSQGESGEGLPWSASAIVLAIVAIGLLAVRRSPAS